MPRKGRDELLGACPGIIDQGWKSKMTTSLVSWEAGSHLLLRKASIAACASTGWPPSTSADFAVPVGAMMPSIFTAPAIDMCCARPGYTGTTLVTIFRVLLSG